jgi:nucleolysin TIA-1/TIAR
MSDINGPPPTSAQLPPPPQTTAGAPGYENGHNGQTNPSHMPPPPLAPVIIPQNTNPIPTAVTSPMGENGGVMSPDSAGGFVRRAAPEPNKRALYVGGLDPRVTEDVLRQIFETTGHVQNVKIIPDKNVGAVSINFICVKSSENSSTKGCAIFSLNGIHKSTFVSFYLLIIYNLKKFTC